MSRGHDPDRGVLGQAGREPVPLRVLELSTGLAAAWAGHWLADGGLDVIRCTLPESNGSDREAATSWLSSLRSDPARTPFNAVDRNKRALALRLDAPDGAAVLGRVLDAADVLISDADPVGPVRGVLEPSRLAAAHPRLVQCIISGGLSGLTGPASWRLGAGAAAGSGLLAVGHDLSGELQLLDLPIAEISAGVHAAIGVLAALHERQTSGRGQLVEVTVAEAATTHTLFLLSKLLRDGRPPYQARRGLRSAVNVCLLECADGAYLSLTSPEPHFWRNFCTAVGRADLVAYHDVYVALIGREEASRTDGANPADPAAREYLAAEIERIIRSRRRDEWVELLQDAECCAAPVRELSEALSDRYTVARGMLHELPHPDTGRLVRQLGIAVTAAMRSGAPIRLAPSPGEHDGALLRELEAASGRAAPRVTLPEPKSGSAARPALGRFRLLDLSRLLPGPLASRLLADFGMDVVMVEEPRERVGRLRDALTPVGVSDAEFRRWTAFNPLARNKRSIAIDLKSRTGRDVFMRLAATADVILEAYTPGVVQRLGVDYEAVRAVNPRIVYCSLTGYGNSGPHTRLPGHDPQFQAMAGLPSLTRDARGRPVHPGFALAADVGGALDAAAAILLALLRRADGGEGVWIDLSLTDSALAYALPASIDAFAGSPVAARHRPLLTLRCRDGRYLVQYNLAPHQWSELCAAIGLPQLAACHAAWLRALGLPTDADLPTAGHAGLAEAVKRIERRMRERTRDDWLSRLADRGLNVAPILEIEEVPSSAAAREQGWFWEREHPRLGQVRQVGNPIRLERTPARWRSFAPLHGEHTEQVLSELGYAPQQVAELLARRAVVGPPAADAGT